MCVSICPVSQLVQGRECFDRRDQGDPLDRWVNGHTCVLLPPTGVARVKVDWSEGGIERESEGDGRVERGRGRRQREEEKREGRGERGRKERGIYEREGRRKEERRG